MSPRTRATASEANLKTLADVRVTASEASLKTLADVHVSASEANLKTIADARFAGSESSLKTLGMLQSMAASESSLKTLAEAMTLDRDGLKALDAALREEIAKVSKDVGLGAMKLSKFIKEHDTKLEAARGKAAPCSPKGNQQTGLSRQRTPLNIMPNLQSLGLAEPMGKPLPVPQTASDMQDFRFGCEAASSGSSARRDGTSSLPRPCPRQMGVK